ncbi:hypothetical protein HPC37_03690 [Pasteurellaceae bacterium 20609_3]|nr:hypothetical protein [Spirabiliibacterium mucosae]
MQDFLIGYSGYNGGDIGSKQNPAIWCCGIEWGGGMSTQELQSYIESKEWQTIGGFEEERENCTQPYDRVVCKILCVIAGGEVENYDAFARTHRVWMKGAKTGYLKMNLFPLSFQDTDPAHWHNGLTALLGFQNKDEYLNWCREYRFPRIKSDVLRYQPKLILCFAKSYHADFDRAFSDNNLPFTELEIEQLSVRWKRNDNGTVIVVLPFPNRPRGLQRNCAIQAIGEFIRTLI